MITFEIALRMRDFAGLQSRLADGEQISAAEMDARYYPSAADYAAVQDWIRSQGLTVTRTDSNRLAVFGRGAVTTVAAAFGVEFGRVSTADGEVTSALTAPSLPAGLAAAVVGVHGLQPHVRLRHQVVRRLPAAGSNLVLTTGYTPSQIAAVYGAAGLNLTGQGQTIAIIGGAFPTASDLSSFWAATGVNTAAGRVQNVVVGSGPDGSDSQAPLEATLDVEWASAMAPAATVRAYTANTSDPNFFDEALQQIAADLPQLTSLHQISVSYGSDETAVDKDYLVILSQYLANLASAGVTVFVSSGDTGSSSNGVLQVSTPASDPNVTCVGGTTLNLDSSNNVTSETGWSGSGGGASAVFARPPWQTGLGVPAGTARLVPDLAAAADPNTGGFIVYNGRSQSVGGTSWSTPVCAAFCALINQARAGAGRGPVGNLNTTLYGLIGSSAVRDITSGSNGAYNCTAGFDEVTGVGVPNVAALVNAALSPPAAPAVYSQLGDRAGVAGQPVTFFVVASGAPPFSYQWQRSAGGAGPWSALSDGAGFKGTQSAQLVVVPTLAMNGDRFQCVVANAAGSTTSAPADRLTVNPFGVSTLAGWPEAWGVADGAGWSARFESPGALRPDGHGNLLVCDGSANTVRKVAPDGTVTTIAGVAGTAGSTAGPVATALLNAPSGVAIDQAGNIFIACDGDYTVRKLSPDGTVSIFAGAAGKSGHVDGAGAAAQFSDPQDIAIDKAGTLYVADGKGNTIRAIAPDGTVSTYAGSGQSGSADGTGSGAAFNDPAGVVADASGNVFVAEIGGNRVRKIAPGAVVTTLITGLNGPTGVAVDPSGNILVADQSNNEVKLYSPSGNRLETAGSTTAEAVDGTEDRARFSSPGQVCWEPVSGAAFIVDTGNYTVRRWAPGVAQAPVFVGSPAAATISSGAGANFTATATGTAPLSYQWQVLTLGSGTWTNLSDGGGYAGTATGSLAISGAGVALSGSQFRCQATNNVGSAASNPATLTVQGAPVILSAATTVSVPTGGGAQLAVTAAGVNLSYQWALNGTAIAGATGSTYTLSNFSAAAAGTYSVAVSNSYGSTNGVVATVSAQSARLTNLSARAYSAAGVAAINPGFVIGGSGRKSLLIRAAGPALLPLGVADALPDPSLLVYDSNQQVVASNTGWGTGSAGLAAIFSAAGAFPFAAGSADSAVQFTAAAGLYTLRAPPVGTDSGSVVAEVYDLDPLTSPARLINVSARAPITATSTSLTAGFVISGTGTEKVLIRAVGPTLANYGITSPLARPVLTVYTGGANPTIIASNAGWGGDPTLASYFTQVQAFSLPNNSADAALEIPLTAGPYTAVVTGLNGLTGVALVEVYEVP